MRVLGGEYDAGEEDYKKSKGGVLRNIEVRGGKEVEVGFEGRAYWVGRYIEKFSFKEG